MSKQNRSRAAQIVPAEEPLPAGTKQVTQTRVERYTEPLPGEGHEQVAPSNDADLTESDETDEVLDEQLLADEDIEDDEELSPLDRFLRSMTDSGDAVIYIRRKTDPPGLQRQFNNPWTSAMVTLGEIPYEDAFTDKTAIDLAVQKIYGGGYFQLQVRDGHGRILKTWSSLIGDVVEPPTARVAAEPVVGPSPPSNSFDELERSLALVERFWKLTNGKRSQSSEVDRTHEPASLPPADPFAVAQQQIDNFDKMTAAMDRLRGPAGNGEQSLGVVALNIVGGVLRDPSVTPVLGAFAQWLIAKAQGSGGPPQEVQNLLKAIVDELTAGHNPAGAAAFTKDFLAKFPQHQTLVAQLANQSSTEILFALSQADPTFTHVRKLPFGPKWIDDFKQLLLSGTSVPPANAAPPASSPAAPPTPSQSAAAPTPAAPAVKALNRVLRRIAADMASSKCINAQAAIADEEEAEYAPEETAVAEVLEFLNSYPEYAAQIKMIEMASPQMIVSQVAQAVDDDELIRNEGSILYAHYFKISLWEALAQRTAAPAPAAGPQTEAVN